MLVRNISIAVTERDVREFFSFSGEIDYIEMQRFSFYLLKFHLQIFPLKVWFKLRHCFTCGSESEKSQLAFVTFKDSQGADTAMLLSVSKISAKFYPYYL